MLDTRCWILVTASAEREAGCWIPDVAGWMLDVFIFWFLEFVAASAKDEAVECYNKRYDKKLFKNRVAQSF